MASFSSDSFDAGSFSELSFFLDLVVAPSGGGGGGMPSDSTIKKLRKELDQHKILLREDEEIILAVLIGIKMGII